jgi:hypothetical protein
MTSSGRLQFLDRDLLTFEFTRGRDIGVQVGGRVAEGKVEYLAGIFNGNAASRLGNDNGKYQYNARVVFEPWGRVGYSESDFDSTDRPLFAIAGQVEHNDQRRAGSPLSDISEYKTVIWVLGFRRVLRPRAHPAAGRVVPLGRLPRPGRLLPRPRPRRGRAALRDVGPDRRARRRRPEREGRRVQLLLPQARPQAAGRLPPARGRVRRHRDRRAPGPAPGHVLARPREGRASCVASVKPV